MKIYFFVFLTLFLLFVLGEFFGFSFLIAPFGATVVILFEFPTGPFSKARNYIGGHLITATLGLLCLEIFSHPGLAIGVACGLSLYLMKLTRTVHPPAAGTPILIILTHQDWFFFLTPLVAGLLIIAAMFELFKRFLLRAQV